MIEDWIVTKIELDGTKGDFNVTTSQSFLLVNYQCSASQTVIGCICSGIAVILTTDEILAESLRLCHLFYKWTLT